MSCPVRISPRARCERPLRPALLMDLRSNISTSSSCLEAPEPLEQAKLALPNMLTLSNDEATIPALRLTGVDCTLPSEEEQSRKKEAALSRLSAYIQLCGGKLDEGWACAVRCRLTTRRNGCLGVTTDNYYYSPTGQTFRSHKQVAEFLGLSEPKKPVSSSGVMVSNNRALQPSSQPLSSNSLSAVSTDSHVSSAINNSMLKRPADLAGGQEPQHAAKRPCAEHAAAVTHPVQTASLGALGAPSNCTLGLSFDLSFAAQAARSAAFHHAAQAALMGPLPVPVPPHSAAVAAPKPCNTPLSKQQPQQQMPAEQQVVQGVQKPAAAVVQLAPTAMPPPPQPPAKRTKALLASKYKVPTNSASAGNSMVAVAAGSGSSSASACRPSTSSPCLGATSSSRVLSHSLSRQDLQQAPVSEQQQQSEQQQVQHNQQQVVHATPAVSASSSKCTVLAAAVLAPSSTACTALSPSKLKQRQGSKQYRTKDSKPVDKQQPPGPCKAKKQPAWRANLRMLASQLAANTASSGSTAASNMGTAVSAANTANEQ